ncbi:MAG: hypothetical protein WBM69_16750 [Desulfobacterales bacterium]
MKKFEIVFFQLSLIILLLACSTVSRIKWVDEDKVTIAWDPVTTMAVDSSNQEGYEIRYLVYIASSDTHEGILVEKYVDDNRIDKETPIAETSCTIEFKDKGHFVIGVQSLICDKDKKIKERSLIAWSDKKIYTHNNPFGVRSGR